MTLSTHQTRVIRQPGVKHLGTDSKDRPVVGKMSGIPEQWRTWAVTRKGEPTDISEPVTYFGGVE